MQTKYAFLEVLDRGAAEAVAETIINKLSVLNNEGQKVLTATSDNGKKFA